MKKYSEERKEAILKNLITGDKRMNLSADLQKKIGIVLDREILPAEHGDVESFANFTRSDVSEISLLEKASGVLAISYIRFRLKGDVDLNRAVSYYASVIQQGISVTDWLRSD
ncbi:hypothetical protein ACO0K9_18900 [Undibacterium sp. Ji50W]|uniref:hypothetical protein n=1 Tax=Undibacterium sp. Ji50W TaxID=3413041 RepID=UPI003BF26D2E